MKGNLCGGCRSDFETTASKAFVRPNPTFPAGGVNRGEGRLAEMPDPPPSQISPNIRHLGPSYKKDTVVLYVKIYSKLRLFAIQHIFFLNVCL